MPLAVAAVQFVVVNPVLSNGAFSFFGAKWLGQLNVVLC
jgi:hypothetical protein